MFYLKRHRFLNTFISLFLVFAFLFQPVAPAVYASFVEKVAELVGRVKENEDNLKLTRSANTFLSEMEDHIRGFIQTKLEAIPQPDLPDGAKSLIGNLASYGIDELISKLGDLPGPAGTIVSAVSGLYDAYKSFRKNNDELLKQADELSNEADEAEEQAKQEAMTDDGSDAKEIGEAAQRMDEKQIAFKNAGERFQAISNIIDLVIDVGGVIAEILSKFPTLIDKSTMLSTALAALKGLNEEARIIGEVLVDMAKDGESSDGEFLKRFLAKNVVKGPSILLGMWNTWKKGFGKFKDPTCGDEIDTFEEKYKRMKEKTEEKLGDLGKKITSVADFLGTKTKELRKGVIKYISGCNTDRTGEEDKKWADRANKIVEGGIKVFNVISKAVGSDVEINEGTKVNKIGAKLWGKATGKIVEKIGFGKKKK